MLASLCVEAAVTVTEIGCWPSSVTEKVAIALNTPVLGADETPVTTVYQNVPQRLQCRETAGLIQNRCRRAEQRGCAQKVVEALVDQRQRRGLLASKLVALPDRILPARVVSTFCRAWPTSAGVSEANPFSRFCRSAFGVTVTDVRSPGVLSDKPSDGFPALILTPVTDNGNVPLKLADRLHD